MDFGVLRLSLPAGGPDMITLRVARRMVRWTVLAVAVVALLAGWANWPGDAFAAEQSKPANRPRPRAAATVPAASAAAAAKNPEFEQYGIFAKTAPRAPAGEATVTKM